MNIVNSYLDLILQSINGILLLLPLLPTSFPNTTFSHDLWKREDRRHQIHLFSQVVKPA